MRNLPSAAILSVLALSVGCQGAEEKKFVSVTVNLGPETVQIRRVYPSQKFPVGTFYANRFLNYELRDRDNDLIAKGSVPDVRRTRSHSFNEAGQISRNEERAMTGVLNLRLPAVPGDLIVFEPRREGRREIGRASFDPTLTAVATRTRAPKDRSATGSKTGKISQGLIEEDEDLPDPVALEGYKNGPLKIIFVPDGYTEGELGAFRARAKDVTDALFALKDYAPFKERFRVERMDIPSKDSGVEADGKNPETAFDLQADDDGKLSFDPAFDLTGGGWDATKSGEDRINSIGNDEAANVMIVLSHSKKGQVSERSNGIILLGEAIGPTKAGFVLGHEIAHILFDLEDEFPVDNQPYSWGDGNQVGCAIAGGQHWRFAANSFFRDPEWIPDEIDLPGEDFDVGWGLQVWEDLPWFDMIDNGKEQPGIVPMPTDGLPGAIGAYSGGVCVDFYYRPTEKCMMHSNTLTDPEGPRMCKVCRREMERYFAIYKDYSGNGRLDCGGEGLPDCPKADNCGGEGQEPCKCGTEGHPSCADVAPGKPPGFGDNAPVPPDIGDGGGGDDDGGGHVQDLCTANDGACLSKEQCIDTDPNCREEEAGCTEESPCTAECAAVSKLCQPPDPCGGDGDGDGDTCDEGERGEGVDACPEDCLTGEAEDGYCDGNENDYGDDPDTEEVEVASPKDCGCSFDPVGLCNVPLSPAPFGCSCEVLICIPPEEATGEEDPSSLCCGDYKICPTPENPT